MRRDELQAILRDLTGSSTDIEAAAVISADGLMMASVLPSGLDDDRVGAMTAALLSLGSRVASEFERGTPDQVLVKGDLGSVLTLRAGRDAALTVVAAPAAKLGLLLLDATRAAAAVARVL